MVLLCSCAFVLFPRAASCLWMPSALWKTHWLQQHQRQNPPNSDPRTSLRYGVAHMLYMLDGYTALLAQLIYFVTYVVTVYYYIGDKIDELC